jgi:hypothetical protein
MYCLQIMTDDLAQYATGPMASKRHHLSLEPEDIDWKEYGIVDRSWVHLFIY